MGGDPPPRRRPVDAGDRHRGRDAGRPVQDLLLVLTRRLPADRVTVTGDDALSAHWLAHTAA
ncbi:hypothetical protein [Amycolatopsis sp. NPDC051716]|uniref:hypothetical protein n=1 Tax=Amycolatopsis sp. NPDC051716 TaxID=3155804 RepID=UPI0034188485